MSTAVHPSMVTPAPLNHTQFPPQFTPYGWLGDIAGAILPTAGQAIGIIAGQPQLGSQIGNIAGQLAQRYSPLGVQPFTAGVQPYGVQPYGVQPYGVQPYGVQPYGVQPYGQQPQLTPYGWLGDIAGAILPTAGQAIGIIAGQPQLGSQIGNIAGQLAQRYSPLGVQPFTAGVQPYGVQPYGGAGAQLAPYGFVGGALGNVLGGIGGNAIGDLLGNQQLGNTIGSTIGTTIGALLPFQAATYQPTPWR